MDYSMIAAPVIGAVIGYATNYIAVKMLFRPMNPIKLCGKTLPFTPGIIPKGKPRIAKAIGTVVSNNLLSEEMLKRNLLSDSMKEKIAQSVPATLTSFDNNEQSIKDCLSRSIPAESIEQYENKAADYITTRIDERLTEQPIGDLIADQVIKAAKEHLSTSFLGKMIGDSVLNPLGDKIGVQINEYLQEHAKEMLHPFIVDECDKLLDTKVTTVTEQLKEREELLSQTVLKLYEWIIEKKLTSMVQELNIAQMIEDQINQMDMKELEDLILSIMKKELNALVNLGALIGFILGLFNLLF